MNQGLHRLVFNRRRGLFVAVGEAARTQGKAGRAARVGPGARSRAAAALAACTLGALAAGLPALAQTATPAARPPVVFARQLPAPKSSLPQPYGTFKGADGRPTNDPALRSFVANPAHRGRVDWVVAPDSKSATFKQGDVDRVILNWDSFDIGAGHRVHFEQNKDPSRYVSALNRIWSADPSVILGQLTADREVILLNANGVYFGRGARVDTGKFVATANSLADAVFERGLRNVVDGSAVFSTAGTDYLPTNLDGAITVEAGAEIRSAAGGDVLLIAPRVVNQGRIDSPQGQAVLAAGGRVYLMSSSDPAQRGLIVAVDPVKLAGSTTVNDPTLGLVENAATGSYAAVGGATVDDATPPSTAGLVQRLNEIHADGGSVNLVGLMVRQAGQINATTAVKGANGAVFLQSMASVQTLAGGTNGLTATSLRGYVVEDGARATLAATGGTVEIAGGSTTRVMPSDNGATQIAAEAFNQSLVRVEGETITVADRASVQAPSGRIELLAATTPQLSPLYNSAAGVAAAADRSRVVVSPGATLSAAGLRDVPVDGARNQAAQRLFRIELADAPAQRDGPLYRQEVFFDSRESSRITVANVAGAAAATRFTAAEKSTTGGTVRLESDGAVVVGEGATVDVSGGSIRYSETTLQTSLLTRDGVFVSLRNAGAGTRYDTLLAETRKTPSPAYDEGRDAGQLFVNGRRMAVAGELIGQVIQGERQRGGTATPAKAGTLAVGRSLSGNQYLSGIALEPGPAAPIDAAIFAAPATVDLGSLPAVTALSLPQVAEGGFGTLVLRAAELTQPAFGRLDLGLGGQLDILAAKMALDGAFTLPGGSVTLLTNQAGPDSAITGLGDIRLSADTRLDAAGLWSNDTLAGGASAASGFAPLQLNGGRVSITAAHSVLGEPGLDVDVSGGARLAGSGSLSRGRAGSITLAAGRADQFDTRLQIDGVRLSGFDFGSGGSLSLVSPGLLVAHAGTAAPVGFDGLRLDPGYFSRGGFGSVSVSASGDVLVASGAAVVPTLSSWLLDAGFRQAASGRMRAAVATPEPVDEALADRLPVNLAISATGAPRAAQGSAGASLVVERGASISLEAGGTLALSATGTLEVGTQGGVAGEKARLQVPGGTLRLSLTGARGGTSVFDADTIGFFGNQATWIGADAELSVAGTAELRTDNSSPAFATFGAGAASPAMDRQTGNVLGGGTIDIANQRGYVVVEAGATLNLDGAAASLNLRGAAAPVTVARAPGRLTISSPEGVALEGGISVRAPRDAAGRQLTDGGSLQVSVAAGGVGGFTIGTPYPSTPRQLLLGDFGSLLTGSGLRPGDDLEPLLGNGAARVPTALLAEAGFDSLRFGAGDRIVFDSSLALSAAVDITLDSPALAARPGVAAELSARTVSLGDRSLIRAVPAADAVASSDASLGTPTSLRLRGQTVEAVGRSVLQGFSSVHLDAGTAAEGEVRFSAVSPAQRGALGTGSGSLGFAGELTITAAQTFVTTASDFSVRGLPASGAGDPGSRIVLRTGGAGAASQPPLSAFGSLALSATDIDHQGVLRQPFGAISIAAERSLTLGDGSLTSVSGAGQTLLFGATDNLSQWLLPFGDYSSVLPLEKRLTLAAPVISTSPSAVVDANGGGAILAPEFFAGVGGSTDYFDTEGLYAVLPDHGNRATLALSGGTFGLDSPGREFVVTMPGSGLAPGSYTLLPARFALLAKALPKGAFLVRRASEQGSALLGAPLVQDDGSRVITGTIRPAGSINPGTPGERFVVESSAVFAQRSEIRLTDVGDLLTRRAGVFDAPVPALPLDAGAIRISTSGNERSLWQAQIEAAAAGGRAGTLDITATRLALVDDLGKTPASALGISAASLGGSGAGSVLIGGLRSAGAVAADGSPTVNIDAAGTVAVNVDVRPDAALRLEELILASSGTLNVATGSRIESSTAGTLGARLLNVVGDGALAFVSANGLESRRTGATPGGTGPGSLTLGAGSVLGGAFVGLDATAQLALSDSARFDAGSLDLSARRIAIGSLAVADTRATTLTGGLLESVRDAEALTLRSYSSIDFNGAQLWAQRTAPGGEATRVLDRVVLDAPVVRGLDGPVGAGTAAEAARTDIAAREIVLRNTLGGMATALPGGVGSITLEAQPPLQYGRTGGLVLGPGESTLAFAEATLRSSGDIVLEGAGGVTAQGDLNLLAARLTAGTAASHAIAADAGRLRIAAAPGSRTLGERVGQGAELRLSAREIVQDGRIDLAAGLLDIQAAGLGTGSVAVSLGAASLTSVAGFSIAGPDGFIVDGPAGRLSVSAGSGRIDLLGALDASAARRAGGTAGEGDAGSIVLRAAGAGGELVLMRDGAVGTLTARAGSRAEDRGGSLTIDAQRLGDTGLLLAAVAAGGIDHELQLRSREGDVALTGTVTAERIRVAADGGSLRVSGGTLDARAANGGVVQLAAGAGVVLAADARIDARSTATGAQGGDVLLSSAGGQITVAPGAIIDARGDDASDGRIGFRALRSADGKALQVDPLVAANLQAAEVNLEAVKVYRQVTVGGISGDITHIVAGNSAISSAAGHLGQVAVNADSTAFMADAAGALDTLGVGADDRPRFHLRSGVEVQAAGALTVGADWALNAARPGGEAGVLTLRAAGNLNINGSLSDGFVSALSTAALSDGAAAWSYRLVAGADLSAADPLAVVGVGDVGSGSLTIAAGRLVRTGAGSIELAAAQDFSLVAGSGNAAAGQVYVAGARRSGEDADAAAALFARQSAKPSFTERGGRLELEVGRDVVATEATQLVNNWLWRSGIVQTTGTDSGLYAVNSHLGWWTEFSRFRQSLGAFGGASIRVRAGRDVVNLQAMAPNAGWADSRLPSAAELRTLGGGEVDVQAGRDVQAGQFLAGRGTGRLTSLGGVAGIDANVAVDEVMLGQMNGASWRVRAREAVALAGSFNPTAVPVSSLDSRANVSSFFYTWGDGSALSLLSAGGAVSYSGGISAGSLSRFGLATAAGPSSGYFRVMPSSLSAYALGGDVQLLGVEGTGAVLFSSDEGNLKVWAEGSVRLGNSTITPNLVLSDSPVSAWPSFINPTTDRPVAVLVGDGGLVDQNIAGTSPPGAIHLGDTKPVRVHAGDSLLQSGDAIWRLSKAAAFSAGNDIVNLRLESQHLDADDRTTLTAGRNLTAGTFGEVEVAGPGTLDVRAGREVDLGKSPGLRTIGNQKNPLLAVAGADIRLAAATAARLDSAALRSAYLVDASEGGSPRSASYRELLRDFVRRALAQPDLSFEQAWPLFQTFSQSAQVELGRQIVAAEFSAVYLGDEPTTASRITAELQAGFEQRRADLLAAGEAALANGVTLLLPGREELGWFDVPIRVSPGQGSTGQGSTGQVNTGPANAGLDDLAAREERRAELVAFLARMRALDFAQLDIDQTVKDRLASREAVRLGWRDQVAASFGSTSMQLDDLVLGNPADPRGVAWREALAATTGPDFERFREQAFETEAVNSARSASAFGSGALPLRLALYDVTRQVARLAGFEGESAQTAWPDAPPALIYRGELEMTQSAAITERGGDIRLLNQGGGVNVGLKVSGNNAAPKGVIALGGGNVFGYSRDDFQVNTQRVFIVGQGDMSILTWRGDIDSGRGANTAVGAPPLAPRRSVDGVVFEIPATTTGSGLGIVPDITGRAIGTIGLYPAFGEILARDAFIRAPSIVLGGAVQGADNLGGGSVSGASAVVAPPPAAVSTPPSNTNESRAAAAAGAGAGDAARDRNSLLTVELLGLGPDDPCEGLTGTALAECRRRLTQDPPRERP